MDIEKFSLSHLLRKAYFEIVGERKEVRRDTNFFKTLKSYKVVKGKVVYKGNNNRLFVCDSLHGEL